MYIAALYIVLLGIPALSPVDLLPRRMTVSAYTNLLLAIEKNVTGDDQHGARAGSVLILAWGTDGRETRRRR